MRKIKTAVIGTGFMGRVHTEAIRRLGNVEVAAVRRRRDRAQNSPTLTTFARRPRISRWSCRILPSRPCTSARPMSCTLPSPRRPWKQARTCFAKSRSPCRRPRRRSWSTIAAKKLAANCVHHNLRYYPNFQQVRQMISHGDLGDILIVQGTYSQDWLLYDTDWNWRLDAKDNGKLRVMGDIGSHWMDMIQHLTGLPITAVCADLATFHKTRKRPKVRSRPSPARNSAGDYEDVAVDTEDFGMVMLHFGDRARGAFTVSQMSAGRKNNFLRDLRDQGGCRMVSGAARHALDRPSQRTKPDHHQRCVAVLPEARICRSSRRPQRRL